MHLPLPLLLLLPLTLHTHARAGLLYAPERDRVPGHYLVQLLPSTTQADLDMLADSVATHVRLDSLHAFSAMLSAEMLEWVRVQPSVWRVEEDFRAGYWAGPGRPVTRDSSREARNQKNWGLYRVGQRRYSVHLYYCTLFPIKILDTSPYSLPVEEVIRFDRDTGDLVDVYMYACLIPISHSL